mmetsp:Transcript_74444/g.198990  ORF Transcript_74444/g.198990 Transcript_74444/m.198990 type:complete len:320 (-) Transcript_74444:1314-2273(-)
MVRSGGSGPKKGAVCGDSVRAKVLVPASGGKIIADTVWLLHAAPSGGGGQARVEVCGRSAKCSETSLLSGEATTATPQGDFTAKLSVTKRRRRRGKLQSLFQRHLNSAGLQQFVQMVKNGGIGPRPGASSGGSARGRAVDLASGERIVAAPEKNLIDIPSTGGGPSPAAGFGSSARRTAGSPASGITTSVRLAASFTKIPAATKERTRSSRPCCATDRSGGSGPRLGVISGVSARRRAAVLSSGSETIVVSAGSLLLGRSTGGGLVRAVIFGRSARRRARSLASGARTTAVLPNEFIERLAHSVPRKTTNAAKRCERKQ